MATGRRESEAVDRRGRILEATIDLLAREGIAGVSMRAVAREAGQRFWDSTGRRCGAASGRCEEIALAD